MFKNFVLLKDLEEPELSVVLSQNTLYSLVTESDLTKLSKVNLDNFVNICNFVDYYQLIDDTDFIEIIQFHVLCCDERVIDNINSIPLNIQRKVYQNPCLKEMKCSYNKRLINIKHVACYNYFNRDNKTFSDIDYSICDASKNGNLDIIKYLFKIGKKCPSDNALICAICYGHLDIVKYLFEVQHQDFIAPTLALYNAIKNGHLEVLKYLFEVQHKKPPIEAIKIASQHGHLEIVKYILEIAPESSTDKAINMACMMGHFEIVKYLFEVVHASYTEEALNTASESGYLDIVKYLIEVQNVECTTSAIDHASNNDQLKVAKYLVGVLYHKYEQMNV